MQHRTTFVLASILTISLVACNGSEGEDGDVQSSAVSTTSASSSIEAHQDGTFTLDGSPNGVVTVKGYGYVEGVHEPFCEKDCENHEYVFFQVLESNDEDFDRYVKQNDGNAYVREGAIGLGCRSGDTIMYVNDSDSAGRQTISMRTGIADAILESSENDPVTLVLTKYELLGGGETPVCYSHISDVTIATEEDSAASVPTATASEAQTSAAMTSAGPTEAGGCIVAGCSGELCVDASEEEIFSPCIWKEEFACYKTATCDRQASGVCAWTPTPELQSCLAGADTEVPGAQ